MKSEDAVKLAKDLDNEGLATLADAVKGEIRNRTPKVMLESIKPGMTPEARKAAVDAIQGALNDH